MSELKETFEAIKKLETKEVKNLVDEVGQLLMDSDLEHVSKSWEGYKDGKRYKAEIKIKLKQIK